jgi:DNA-binding NarL/FixJ family response regulator
MNQPPDLEEQASKLCQGLRFFVVEDHPFQLGLVIGLLQQLGALEARGFVDADSAMAAIVGEPAAAGVILLVDLALPGTNGMELIEAIGARQPQVSIIMNSALGEDMLVWPLQVARSYGATVLGAISKPITAAKLVPLIARYRPIARQ